MYGKIFESTFTGSLCGAGPTVFAVWGYVIANNELPGVVELNPTYVAAAIGTTEAEIQKAIDFLCSPDPKSRNPDEEGRRLVYLRAHAYRIVSFDTYHKMRDAEARQEYMRDYMRNYMRGKREVNAACTYCGGDSATAHDRLDRDDESNIETVPACRKCLLSRKNLKLGQWLLNAQNAHVAQATDAQLLKQNAQNAHFKRAPKCAIRDAQVRKQVELEMRKNKALSQLLNGIYGTDENAHDVLNHRKECLAYIKRIGDDVPVEQKTKTKESAFVKPVKQELNGHAAADLNGTEVHEFKLDVAKEVQDKPKRQRAKSTYDEKAFTEFWNAYPRKSDKMRAQKSFAAISPDRPTLSHMLTTIERCKHDRVWSDPKFIPLPSTWLNNKRWEDELELDPELAGAHSNSVRGSRFVA